MTLLEAEIACCGRGRLLVLIMSLVLTIFSGCAAGGNEDERDPGSGSTPDSDSPPATDEPTSEEMDESSPSTPSTPSDRPSSDRSSSEPDAGSSSSRPDAGSATADPPARSDAGTGEADSIDDLLDGLFDDADAGAVSSPPDPSGGAWTLDDGSFEDCPAEPPPIPIIGGPCLGVYFSCSWSDPSGATYTCICDWVHWLCI